MPGSAGPRRGLLPSGAGPARRPRWARAPLSSSGPDLCRVPPLEHGLGELVGLLVLGDVAAVGEGAQRHRRHRARDGLRVRGAADDVKASRQDQHRTDDSGQTADVCLVTSSAGVGMSKERAGYPACGASNRVTGGGDAGMTAGRQMPTQDDVLRYFDTLSNWGRWGDDDELGTLNHITDDVRLAAARAVRHGRSVSCAWEITVPEEMERSTTTCPCAADMPGAENMPVPGFRNDRRWGFSNERLGIMFHGNTVTHVDSPCHIFWDGTMYNGRSHSLVDPATGSAWAAVTAAANGIITRGVLLDIARVRD